MSAASGQATWGRLAGRTVAAVIIGWAVVYNILRIQGDEPDQAAWPSLLVGGVLGAAIYLGGVVILRRVRGPETTRVAQAIPGPGQLNDDQREALRVAAFALAALAICTLLMGAIELGDWIGTDSADRGFTELILGGWNVLFAIWAGDVGLRAFKMDGEDLESIPLGAALTAILAGLGIARDIVVPGQIALAAVAGICGAIVGLAAWRISGGRGVPGAAIVAIVVAALSIVLPLAAG